MHNHVNTSHSASRLQCAPHAVTGRSARRRTLAGALAIALAAGVLSGCASEEVPEPPAAQEWEGPALPALDETRLTAIVDRINAGAAKADQDQNIDEFRQVAVGPAATEREAEYQLKAKIEDYALIPLSLTNQAASTEAREDFPRTSLLITEPADKQLPLLAALRQDSARDNTKLHSWVRLFPGVTLPSMKTLAVGVDVQAESGPILYDPAEVLARFIDQIYNREGGNKDLFTDDALTATLWQMRDSYAEAVKEVGEVELGVNPGDAADIIAFPAAEGGQVVFATFTSTLKITRTVAGSTITLSDQIAKLLGDGKVKGSVTGTYFTTVAFYVPQQGGDKTTIDVLGATTVLQKADRDDEASPDRR